MEQETSNFSIRSYDFVSYDSANFTNRTDYFEYNNGSTVFDYANETDFELTLTHKFIDFLSHYYGVSEMKIGFGGGVDFAGRGSDG